jgi:hypothetical protein
VQDLMATTRREPVRPIPAQVDATSGVIRRRTVARVAPAVNRDHDAAQKLRRLAKTAKINISSKHALTGLRAASLDARRMRCA